MASRRLIPLEPLTPAAFAPFGTVIQNPSTAPSSASSTITPTTANQGTATKYPEICAMENFYHLAPSKKPSRPQMSMFVCKPRQLRKPPDPNDDAGIHGLLDIALLERHPYTTQTFIPLGLSVRDPATCYLVIVAPTLPASASREQTRARATVYPVPDAAEKRSRKDKQARVYARGRPRPFENDRALPVASKPTPAPSPWSTSHSSRRRTSGGQSGRSQRAARLPKGAGTPSWAGVRAFLARGDQAVTYGAGTWHAPMVVVGAEAVEFVVVQFGNGVALEDCQEVEVGMISEDDGTLEGISVVIDKEGVEGGNGLAELRSKL